MTSHPDALSLLQSINRSAEFNRWCGIEVIGAEPGHAEIAMPWRREAGQYSGFLHAGLVATLIDTACGYAAATVVGANVLAAHFSVNCIRPAVGSRFVARARVVKAGKLQVFTSCELFAQSGTEEKLVATGETLLTVVKGNNEASARPHKRFAGAPSRAVGVWSSRWTDFCVCRPWAAVAARGVLCYTCGAVVFAATPRCATASGTCCAG